ncbi:hypothetical protein [Bradyrhizobium sp. 150]|uniref:thiolase family protein n=1 Tax=Bradyrhizobium sp. 150 TaxID=2782625 RepID=UPI001FF9BE51|nr:hypothetical protein [Bradyrhizobium sp. 150]MCK1676398.1 hypothetical protein [Bradyrhizobium sp. 150]
MPEAYIYACNRGGCGESDGTLQAVTSVRLAIVPLEAVKDCNKAAENSVDNIILRAVDPVGEAGSNVACVAAPKAGLNESAPDVQISRFCNSGLDAVKFAAALMAAVNHILCVQSRGFTLAFRHRKLAQGLGRGHRRARTYASTRISSMRFRPSQNRREVFKLSERNSAGSIA